MKPASTGSEPRCSSGTKVELPDPGAEAPIACVPCARLISHLPVRGKSAEHEGLLEELDVLLADAGEVRLVALLR